MESSVVNTGAITANGNTEESPDKEVIPVPVKGNCANSYEIYNSENGGILVFIFRLLTTTYAKLYGANWSLKALLFDLFSKFF